jgi:hypothetical protein
LAHVLRSLLARPELAAHRAVVLDLAELRSLDVVLPILGRCASGVGRRPSVRANSLMPPASMKVSELLTRCGVLEGMWKKDEPEFAKQSS